MKYTLLITSILTFIGISYASTPGQNVITYTSTNYDAHSLALYKRLNPVPFQENTLTKREHGRAFGELIKSRVSLIERGGKNRTEEYNARKTYSSSFNYRALKHAYRECLMDNTLEPGVCTSVEVREYMMGKSSERNNYSRQIRNEAKKAIGKVRQESIIKPLKELTHTANNPTNIALDAVRGYPKQSKTSLYKKHYDTLIPINIEGIKGCVYNAADGTNDCDAFNTAQTRFLDEEKNTL